MSEKRLHVYAPGHQGRRQAREFTDRFGGRWHPDATSLRGLGAGAVIVALSQWPPGDIAEAAETAGAEILDLTAHLPSEWAYTCEQAGIAPLERTCGNCRWWQQDPGNDQGFCKRRAPSNEGQFYWPLTTGGQWCGDYEPRDQTTEQGGGKP